MRATRQVPQFPARQPKSIATPFSPPIPAAIRVRVPGARLAGAGKLNLEGGGRGAAFRLQRRL
jgi:hypothetical protein